MTVLRALTADDFPAIHRAFLSAFSDYVVKLSPTEAQLMDMFTRRGWVPGLSCGAFDGEEMIGFTVNALRGTDGYNTGTGVIPSHRGRGLAREMMEWSCQALRRVGATRYLLEVIDTNVRALALYRSCRFVETRRLQSWTYESSAVVPAGELEPDWARWTTWWDVEPAWQNTTASVLAAPEPPRFIGDESGYAIVFPWGDVPQLAVARGSRRRGIGRRLLDAAASVAGGRVRIMNIDTANEDVAAFLESCGAQRFVMQIEMARSLE
jgi:ribosomal protein S18 acetylase RimI-like enzyme